MKTLDQLVSELNSFDPDMRRNALIEIASSSDVDSIREGVDLNMHFHSFFSYNAESYSPTRIAWEARRSGMVAAGLCDFDVLDGLEEFLEAGRILGLRVTVNLETRAYLADYAGVDISSPGEAGVTYIMGAGFARMPEESSDQAHALAGYRERADQRNVSLVDRINAELPQIAINYERDVLPLTPANSATERHIISAYVDKAADVAATQDDLVRLWCDILAKEPNEVESLLQNRVKLEDVVRQKLAKRGGVGYIAPSVDTFPSVEDFIAWVLSCEAIPMITWLDGTSEGEEDGQAMLECMRDKGAAALNIIPDRNWNVSDADEKAIKTGKLKDIIEAADSMGLPVNIGTEMNRAGLPFTDNLSCSALSPYRGTFTRGAAIMVGHTLLLRYADYSYTGDRASQDFGDMTRKNDFFASVGMMPPVGQSLAKELEEMGRDKALVWFRSSI